MENFNGKATASRTFLCELENGDSSGLKAQREEVHLNDSDNKKCSLCPAILLVKFSVEKQVPLQVFQTDKI